MSSRKHIYYQVKVCFTVFVAALFCIDNWLISQTPNLTFYNRDDRTELYLHVPTLYETIITRADPEFPVEILSFLEERSEKIPLSVALGVNFKLFKEMDIVYFQTGVSLWNLPYRQKIEVMADPGHTFSIERSILNRSVAVPLVMVFQPFEQVWENFRLGLFAGLEFRVLQEKWQDEESFIFKRLEDLNNSTLLNELNLQQNNRETTVFRNPTMPIQGFWYWDIQAKLGLSYRLPLTSGLALDLTATWISPIQFNNKMLFGRNNQLKIDERYTNEDWWGNHYYLKSDGKRLEIQEYLGLRLVYTFNQEDWVLRKIGVK